MAYFAELDINNIVLRVVVVADEVSETEENGIAWCENFFNGGIWKQTWIDGGKRKNYAAINSAYNPSLDIFLPIKPFLNFVINSDGTDWVPPIPYPTDGGEYVWYSPLEKWVPMYPNDPTKSYYWDDSEQTWKAVE
jgi:hypothetical protein